MQPNWGMERQRERGRISPQKRRFGGPLVGILRLGLPGVNAAQRRGLGRVSGVWAVGRSTIAVIRE